jgi:uncharacterized protein YaaQ
MGLPATLIHAEESRLAGGRYTLLIGAPDVEVVQVVAVLAQHGGALASSGGGLLPLSDPSDLHIGEEGGTLTGGGPIYVLPVRRFEQFW